MSAETSSDTLRQQIRAAQEAFDAMPRHQQIALEREARISWVWGEHCLQYDPPVLTREQCAAIVDEHLRKKRMGLEP